MSDNIKNLIGAVMVALAGFTFWALVLPGYDKISAISPAITARQELLEPRQKIIQKIKDLNSQYGENSENARQIAMIAPKDTEIPEIISAIPEIAQKSGLQLSSLGISKGNVSSTEGEDKDIGFLVLNLDASGNYQAFKYFLESAEKHIRLIDIQSLDAGYDEKTKNLALKISARVYFLKEASPASAQQSAQTNETNSSE